MIAILLEDIDWRVSELMVRGKGKQHDCVPIPPDVGGAISAYLRGRVSDSRHLFITERAPYRPFKDSQVFNTILRDAFARAGVTPPAPYVGSHVLRHSWFGKVPRWKRWATCCATARAPPP